MSDGVAVAATATATATSRRRHLQDMLQRAVQTVQWTYTIYWRLCYIQRILVWGDGYYNGGIKTRKSVQQKEVSTEEASLQRSQQLRELYELLCSDGGGETANHQTANKNISSAAAALSPEDLSETEWFYLLCFSYSFPPGTGLPGWAYAKRQHVWLTAANEVDSLVFSRTLLAKSAQIQTVVCIPLLDGVVEVGTTERVEEDLGFIQKMTNFFIHEELAMHPPTKPALSEHSTSNPPPIIGYYNTTSPAAYINTMSHHQQVADRANQIYAKDEEEEVGAVLLINNKSDISSSDHMMIHNPNYSIPQSQTQSSDLMQLDYISSQYISSPDYGSWECGDHHPESQLNIFHAPLSSSGGVSSVNELRLQEEDTYYFSQTLATILQPESNRYWFSDTSISSSETYIHHLSSHSAFVKWSSSSISSTSNHLGATSQRKLKYILFTVPFLYNSKDISCQKQSSTTTTGFYTNASHVLSERRRREKLNERFIMLRSTLPFAAKVDKATILGDAIEYVKQLRNKIEELEEAQGQHNVKENVRIEETNGGESKEKMRKGKRQLKAGQPVDQSPVHVEVSIIEKDALVEMQCPYREGLLLDVMQILRQLRLEVTAVQSYISNGLFVAKLKGKVKGRKATIMEVKRAIHQTVACGIGPSQTEK